MVEVAVGLKVCSMCSIPKSLEEFYKRGSTGKRMAHCRTCHVQWTLRWHSENKELHAKQMQDRKLVLKLEAMEHYGKVCACCQEPREKFLELDHINNDGAEHRQKVGRWRVGVNMFRLLKKLEWPLGFQFLCSNCNMAKSRYGSCPHESEVVN